MFKAGGQTVEKAGKTFAQSGYFITSRPQRLSKILQRLFFEHKLYAAFTQFTNDFTQSKFGVFNLLGGLIYTFSPATNVANKLNKGL